MNDKVNYEYTDWYPKEVLPSVPGVYQVQTSFFPMFTYWNGEKFGWRSTSPFDALRHRNETTKAGDIAIWRGLTRQSAMEIRNEIR